MSSLIDRDVRERGGLPICPACKHALTVDEMNSHREDLWALATDETRTEIECPACGVTYHCQGGYSPHYDTALNEDEL
jgi:uncharacterized protein YbaR (Trm112 family)